ncbi:MAG: hypothetical protein C0602_04430 [Denitrovibrio sp.]|nr:MAG: hypothetical protein C0602_04430 [Denitrovibrio sp.]
MFERGNIRLNRFEIQSISGSKYTNISCSKGSVWITAGKGFSDLILKAGQSISVISKSAIVIEALSESEIEICSKTSQEFKQQALQN